VERAISESCQVAGFAIRSDAIWIVTSILEKSANFSDVII
jgi:hypothetical protein